MKKAMVKSGDLDATSQSILGNVSRIIEEARRSAARSVNAVSFSLSPGGRGPG